MTCTMSFWLYWLYWSKLSLSRVRATETLIARGRIGYCCAWCAGTDVTRGSPLDTDSEWWPFDASLAVSLRPTRMMMSVKTIPWIVAFRCEFGAR